MSVSLEHLLLKHDITPKSSASVISTSEIEKEFGFKLPSDYVLYLQKYLPFEGFIGEQFLILWDIDSLIENNTSYHITSLENTIGIGSNAAGEFIAIEFDGSASYRVVLSPFIDLDKECHIEIGNSFSDFLIRLDQGKDWFD